MSAASPARAASAETTPLPVALLTGFLGSGKTSFLRRVLADPEASWDTAVLINEFGEVGLDHLMVEATRPGDVVQLPSGCMCCAVKQDLALALHRLLTSRANGTLPPFRRVAIETSGLAEPAPILYTLAAEGIPGTHAALRPRRDHRGLGAGRGDHRAFRGGHRAGCVCRPAADQQARPAACFASFAGAVAVAQPVGRRSLTAQRLRHRRRLCSRRHRRGAGSVVGRRGAQPRHHRVCTGPAPRHDPDGIRRGVGRSGTRTRRGSAARQGIHRVRPPTRAARPNCTPCSTRSTRRAGSARGPMRTTASVWCSSSATSRPRRSSAASMRGSRRSSPSHGVSCRVEFGRHSPLGKDTKMQVTKLQASYRSLAEHLEIART